MVNGVSSNIGESIYDTLRDQLKDQITLQDTDTNPVQSDTIVTIVTIVTIKNLCNVYSKLNTTDCENYFMNVKLNGKTRKVGKALSKKIYEYFCC